MSDFIVGKLKIATWRRKQMAKEIWSVRAKQEIVWMENWKELLEAIRTQNFKNKILPLIQQQFGNCTILREFALPLAYSIL